MSAVIKKRRSVRLKNYDYSHPGAYFVTVCAHEKKCLFGKNVESRMELNALGKIVEKHWMEIPKHFQTVSLDQFIVVPNHIHGILIVNVDGRGMACHAPTPRRFGKPVSNSLPTVVGSFKSAVSKTINESRNGLRTTVWQRNYYEHVIRNEKDLKAIREYIEQNPLKWSLDEENPDCLIKKGAK